MVHRSTISFLLLTSMIPCASAQTSAFQTPPAVSVEAAPVAEIGLKTYTVPSGTKDSAFAEE